MKKYKKRELQSKLEGRLKFGNKEVITKSGSRKHKRDTGKKS